MISLLATHAGILCLTNLPWETQAARKFRSKLHCSVASSSTFYFLRFHIRLSFFLMTIKLGGIMGFDCQLTDVSKFRVSTGELGNWS